MMDGVHPFQHNNLKRPKNDSFQKAQGLSCKVKNLKLTIVEYWNKLCYPKCKLKKRLLAYASTSLASLARLLSGFWRETRDRASATESFSKHYPKKSTDSVCIFFSCKGHLRWVLPLIMAYEMRETSKIHIAAPRCEAAVSFKISGKWHPSSWFYGSLCGYVFLETNGNPLHL